MSNEKRVNRFELAEILKDEKNYNGCSFVGFDLLTKVKLTGGQKNPMQGRVQKVHTGFVAMLFSNKTGSAYGKMVNRRKVQEGKEADFNPSNLPWGVKTKNTAHIEHKGNDYVQKIYVQHAVKLLDLAEQMGVELNENDAELYELMKQKVVGYNTPNGNISYLLDSKPIAKDDIEGLPTKKNNGKQGGLSEAMKVIVRAPKLASITRMTFNGTKYIVED